MFKLQCDKKRSKTAHERQELIFLPEKNNCRSRAYLPTVPDTGGPGLFISRDPNNASRKFEHSATASKRNPL